MPKPKLNKYGRPVRDKSDKWSRVNAKKFKKPVVAGARLGGAYGDVAGRVSEAALKLARKKHPQRKPSPSQVPVWW